MERFKLNLWCGLVDLAAFYVKGLIQGLTTRAIRALWNNHKKYSYHRSFLSMSDFTGQYQKCRRKCEKMIVVEKYLLGYIRL